MVYDVTSRASFTSINRWLDELRDHALHDLVIILVGNKIDLEAQRQVSTEEGKVRTVCVELINETSDN